MSNRFQMKSVTQFFARDGVIRLAALAWVIAIVVGSVLMLEHAYSSGAEAEVAQRWPEDVSLPRSGEKPVLVMAVHPRCPCTRSSMEQLDRLLSQLPGKAEAFVLFCTSPGQNATLEESATWRHAQRIQGLQVIDDAGGKLAGRFSATTSGETLLFSPEGDLLFHGGLTASRGHAGNSVGYYALIALLQGKTPAVRTAPAFGCSIQSEVGS